MVAHQSLHGMSAMHFILLHVHLLFPLRPPSLLLPRLFSCFLPDDVHFFLLPREGRGVLLLVVLPLRGVLPFGFDFGVCDRGVVVFLLGLRDLGLPLSLPPPFVPPPRL